MISPDLATPFRTHSISIQQDVALAPVYPSNGGARLHAYLRSLLDLPELVVIAATQTETERLSLRLEMPHLVGGGSDCLDRLVGGHVPLPLFDDQIKPKQCRAITTAHAAK